MKKDKVKLLIRNYADKDGYCLIYLAYQNKEKTLRLNTAVKAKLAEFNKVTERLEGRRKDDKDNAILQSLKSDLSNLVSNYFLNNKEFPSFEWVKSNFIIKQDVPLTDVVVELFKIFIDEKRITLKTKDSIKDYESLYHALIDYQLYSKKTLTFEILNDEVFFNNFWTFLSKPHKKLDGYTTKGNLTDNTIAKRTVFLKAFLNWVEEKELFIFKKKIFKLKIRGYQSESIALTKSDITTLMNLELTGKEDEVRDVFVLNCFLGMRWSDLETFENGIFKIDELNNIWYHKTTEKTNTPFAIPLSDTAITILNKYKTENRYLLPIIGNQPMNLAIKALCKKHKIFTEKIKVKEQKLEQQFYHEYPKHDLISTHSCRRTYVTLAFTAGYTANQIKGVTGHSKLSTLLGYVKEVNNTDLKDIDKK